MSQSTVPCATGSRTKELAELITRLLLQPECIEPITEKLQEIDSRLQTSNGTLEQLERAVAIMREGQDWLLARNEVLEDATKTQLLLGEQHYQQHVIEPLSRRLLSLVELARCSAKYELGVDDLKRLIDGFHEQVMELLEQYGCVRFESAEGAQFDPSRMNPTAVRAAPSRDMHGKVAMSVQPGYRTADRVLRFEKVVIYSNGNDARSEEQ